MTALTISTLSNAKFLGLRRYGVAKIPIGEDDQQYVIKGFTPENLEALKQAFDAFVERFKNSCDGVHPRRRLLEAHDVFESAVVPALKSAAVEVIDAMDYSNSQIRVEGNPDELKQIGESHFPVANVRIKIPLRRGFRKFWNNSNYDAHARFEEVLHLFQFVNGAPLTAMGLSVEQALNEREPEFLRRLKKSVRSAEGKRLLVRENDIMGVYEEYGLELPGIFLFPYERREVLEYFRSLRLRLAM